MTQMKNSGIEWIGSIPQSWDVFRFKNIIKDSISGEVIDKGYWNDGSELLYTCQRTPMNSTFDKFPQSKRTTEKDLLLTRNATPYVFIPVPNSIYSNVVQKVTLHDGWDKRYIRYAIQLGADEQQVNGDTIPSYNMDVWKNIYICKIPLNLQVRIANFLDQKCSEIDYLSADIQSQIDVLEEYKKSVITEAVTKGLNSDVEMKDSGIEWIGMIPAHWDVHPVYHYFGERKVKNSALKEQNLLSLSYGKIVRKDIETLGGLLPASFNTYNIVEPNDIIIRPTDLQNDKRSLRTGLVTEHGIITSAYIDLMPKANVNAKYFHYLLHSYDVMKVFYNMGNGVRQGLNYSEFAKLMIFAPSIHEQQQIAGYLDAKCAEIDAVIADKKAQLETLAEYKKSLIYEYVTGKKEVPENV